MCHQEVPRGVEFAHVITDTAHEAADGTTDVRIIIHYGKRFATAPVTSSFLSLRILECLSEFLDNARGLFVVGDDVLEDIVHLSMVVERRIRQETLRCPGVAQDRGERLVELVSRAARFGSDGVDELFKGTACCIGRPIPPFP